MDGQPPRIEALIRAGAFDTIALEQPPDRHKLLATVGIAIEAADQIAANAMQSGLFDIPGEAAPPMADYVKVRPWGEHERLKEEKLAIGFFLSGHPFNAFKEEVRRFVRRTLTHVEASRDLVTMAGVVMEVRAKMTARGKVAFVLLDDGTTPREVSVFSENYENNRHRIVVDEVLIVEAKVSNDDFSGGYRIVADKLMTLGEARGRFGTMTFGNEADDKTSQALMERALEAGINFFDAAHNYNLGKTEEIVGRWIGPHRDQIILTSKVFFPSGGGMNDQGISRRNIIRSVEKSLKRLQTDYIDIVYLHHWDENVSIEQSMGALNTLIEQGKVHYAGVSNFSA